MDTLIYLWPLLVLSGLGLRMALRLWYGARGPGPSDWLYTFLNVVAWLLMLIGLLPAVLGSAFSIFGLIVLFLAAAAVVESVVERRAAQRRSMCRLLALATEHGQQIDPSLLVVEPIASTYVGRAMTRLLESVRGGTPLAAAIYRNPAALPAEAVAYVAAGRSIDAESAALKELSQTDRSELATVWRTCVDRISYLGVVLLFMFLILTFVMIKIVPEFEKIFSEFDLELPKMTLMAVSVSNLFVNYLVAPLLGLIAFGLLTLAIVALCYMGDVKVMRSIGDRVFRGRRTADVLRILAVATEHRQPIATAFERLAYVYPSKMLRRQLATASSAVAAGGDWRNALANARFVSRSEQSLLKTAEQAGNLPWALRAIATRQEQRTVYRLAAAVQVLYPLLIVLPGRRRCIFRDRLVYSAGKAGRRLGLTGFGNEQEQSQVMASAAALRNDAH